MKNMTNNFWSFLIKEYHYILDYTVEVYKESHKEIHQLTDSFLVKGIILFIPLILSLIFITIHLWNAFHNINYYLNNKKKITHLIINFLMFCILSFWGSLIFLDPTLQTYLLFPLIIPFITQIKIGNVGQLYSTYTYEAPKKKKNILKKFESFSIKRIKSDPILSSGFTIALTVTVVFSILIIIMIGSYIFSENDFTINDRYIIYYSIILLILLFLLLFIFVILSEAIKKLIFLFEIQSITCHKDHLIISYRTRIIPDKKIWIKDIHAVLCNDNITLEEKNEEDVIGSLADFYTDCFDNSLIVELKNKKRIIFHEDHFYEFDLNDIKTYFNKLKLLVHVDFHNLL